jgi:hypothetical protein
MKEVTKTATAADRNIPAIRPKDQSGHYWQSQGQAWREAFIVLPPGLVSQDLTDYPNEAWRLIQQDRNLALRRLDKVFCISADGTWAVEARVGFADMSRVALTKPTVIQLPDPADAGLYSDATYRVVPFPGGYAVENVRSGARLGDQIYPNPAAAKAAVLAQYPTKVA